MRRKAKTETDILEEMLEEMPSCAFEYLPGVRLECIEANGRGLPNKSVPICPRCKIRQKLEKFTIDAQRISRS